MPRRVVRAPPGGYGTGVTRVLYDDVLETFYGQLDIVWDESGGFDGDYDRFFTGQANGLVGAADAHGVYIGLARFSGGSPVRIVLEEDEPVVDATAWEDVVEVSTVVPDGAAPAWTTWAGEDRGDLDLPPGSYRVRVSARGRDDGAADEFAEGPVDFYLVEFWPAPAAPDAVVRTTSENAAYWHAEVGSRR